ncbi:MAG: hypothetical protein FJZ66_02910 [Bacteroidetes bacterium]|nr:hypothetical protein [Bacteroidota bacterium]
MENNILLIKKKRWKKWLKYSYYTVLYLFAAAGAFMLCLYIAVEFKLTNVDGAIDIKNRYFEEISDKYGNDLVKDGASNPKEEIMVFQKIGVIAKYRPSNAKSIMEAYLVDRNVVTANRMIDAFALILKDNQNCINELSRVGSQTNYNTESAYEWSNYTVWKQFSKALVKDKKAIDSVSRLTGVESRTIIVCVIAEQLRMFNSGREKFKEYVYPFANLILPTNRGYGVSGILEHTALRIERTLSRPNDEFYPGDYFRYVVNFQDSFPERVNDSIAAHKHKTIQRLIKGGDHFYSYLYTALLLRQYQSQWERAGFSLANRPDVLGTLFNLGYQKSVPKKNPQVGGSTFVIGEKEYTFGGICFEFYYSGELQKEFPITGRGFIPIKELEKNNQQFIAAKKKLEREVKSAKIKEKIAM